MSQPIESYGFIGNMLSGALVGRDGSIDWLCLPRFDSDACFAALLGTPEHGRWLIAPEGETKRTRRRYRPGTAILETTFETADGIAQVIDFMPRTEDEEYVDLVRLVQGVKGRVRMRTELIVRFGYGKVVPWVRRQDFGISAIAGPDALELRTPVELRGRDFTTVGEFSVGEGAAVPFLLDYHPSYRPAAHPPDCYQSLEETERFWSEWSGRCVYGDHVAPHVIPPATPGDGSTGQPTNAALSVTFSEPMNQASVQGAFALKPCTDSTWSDIFAIKAAFCTIMVAITTYGSIQPTCVERPFRIIRKSRMAPCEEFAACSIFHNRQECNHLIASWLFGS